MLGLAQLPDTLTLVATIPSADLFKQLKVMHRSSFKRVQVRMQVRFP
jgi:hypothetical protein